MAERRVVLISGPPGSGKTTLAHALGLTVYDRDDAKWRDNRHFNAALTRVGRDPNAQAVVIRSGATRDARARAALQVQATETILLTDVPLDECVRRVIARGRTKQKMGRQTSAIRGWFKSYTEDVTEGRVYTPTKRPGGRTWANIVRQVVARDAGICWLCGKDGATSGDHVIPISKGGAPLDMTNVRAAHLECNMRRGNRAPHPAKRALVTSRRW